MTLKVMIQRDGEEALDAEEDFSVDLDEILERDFGVPDDERQVEEFRPFDDARLYGPKTRLQPTNGDYATRIADAYEGVFTIQDVNRAMSVFTEVILRAFAEDKVITLQGLGHFYSKPRVMHPEVLENFLKNMKRHQSKAHVRKDRGNIIYQFYFRPAKVLQAAATQAGRKRLIEDAVRRSEGPISHQSDSSADG